jgi:hypothetical protein
MWIAKPGGSSRGRGIKVFSDLKKIIAYVGIVAEKPDEFTKSPTMYKTSCEMMIRNAMNNWIVQKYIENPLIILNRKVDLRVWVVITQWNPIRIFFYNESYVRFGCHDYMPDDPDNIFSHLTNNAITGT